MVDHCCRNLKEGIETKNMPLIKGIVHIYGSPRDSYNTQKMEILFCPFCGKKIETKGE